jgi:hypothetical protein
MSAGQERGERAAAEIGRIGEPLVALQAQLEAARRANPGLADTEARARLFEIEQEIARTPARTMEGLRVKLALLITYLGEGDPGSGCDKILAETLPADMDLLLPDRAMTAANDPVTEAAAARTPGCATPPEADKFIFECDCIYTRMESALDTLHLVHENIHNGADLAGVMHCGLVMMHDAVEEMRSRWDEAWIATRGQSGR